MVILVAFSIVVLCICLSQSSDKYTLVKDSVQEISDNKKGEYTLITVPSFEIKPGDKVQVPVNISGNPGILGMTLTVNYDEDCLTMDKAEDGDVFKNVLTLTKSKALKSGARFVWYGLDVGDKDIRDGSMLNMYFTISKNAKPGKYPIRLTFGDKDIVDKNLKNIMPVVEQGIVTIK